MKIDTLNTLFQEEIKDLYDAEKRLVRAIPKMAKAATSEDLRTALMEHLEVTRNQVGRLEEIFNRMKVPAKAKPCEGMKGIIEEGEGTMDKNAEDHLMDVAIIGAAQRVEHYEMAAYAAARAIAENLGQREVAKLLQQTWEEENEADEKLAELAGEILKGAQSAGAPGGRPMARKAAGRSGDEDEEM